MPIRHDVDGRVHVFDYLILAAPAFSTVLLVWAENLIGVGHPERLLLIGGVAWVALSWVWR
jgi:hypothetical protein